MQQLFELPALLRIIIFSLFSVFLVLLIIFIISHFVRKYKKYLETFHLIFFFISLFMMSVTRTPLNITISAFFFYFCNSLIVFSVFSSLIMLYHSKRFLYFLDFIFFFINLPIWMFLKFFYVIYLVSICYLIIRMTLLVFDELDKRKSEPGIYIIKAALDSINCGVAFSNYKGQIIFINNIMKQYFDMLKIKEHNKITRIVDALINCKQFKRFVSEQSFIIEINDIALNFQFSSSALRKNITQLICYDVSEEEKVIDHLANSRNELDRIQNDLLKANEEIAKIEEEKEVLRLKGNLHDIMSQRLSILHCYIIENKGEDIYQIKQLISSMLLELYDEKKLNSQNRLQNLVHSFAIINVQLNIKGALPDEKQKADLLFKIIRECTTNAVRHGNAHQVDVEILKYDPIKYHLIIKNDGYTSLNITEGNGLKNIRYHIEELKGQIKINPYPSFCIEIIV